MIEFITAKSNDSENCVMELDAIASSNKPVVVVYLESAQAMRGRASGNVIKRFDFGGKRYDHTFDEAIQDQIIPWFERNGYKHGLG